MRTLPLAEAKAKLGALVDDVARRHERVAITRRGRPTVVIRRLPPQAKRKVRAALAQLQRDRDSEERLGGGTPRSVKSLLTLLA